MKLSLCLWLVLISLALISIPGCATHVAERYGIVSVRPDAGAYLIFDSATGDMEFRPLPKHTADKAEIEVRN